MGRFYTTFFWFFTLSPTLTIYSSSSLSFFIIICLFFCVLGSINSFANWSSRVSSLLLPGFFSYFTLSAYLKVFRVFSHDPEPGEMFPIIKVLQNPVNESFRTIVSLLPLKGVWLLPWSSALIHSLRASRDLLIYAPSILVCLFWSKVSAPLSHPARSINEIFP